MDVLYYHKDIEPKVQDYWVKAQATNADDSVGKRKYYCLSMLPYPSGKLHMGHIRNYTIGDVIARFQRIKGKHVLNPIGWDAFGLPAEAAAVNNRSIPSEWTHNNINHMREQLKSMGYSFDWVLEIITCEPEYYRWEQWMYMYIYKKKFSYKTKTAVNWCSIDKTVLANEQVVNGNCWRCNKSISFKRLSQWFIKITTYAEDLLKDLTYLHYWPIGIKDMQRSWIHRYNPIESMFMILDLGSRLAIYVIEPTLLLRTSYIELSAYHCLSLLSLNNKPTSDVCLRSKLGGSHSYQEDLDTGLLSLNPLTSIKISVWVVNHMLIEYGTGISIGIPSIYKEDLSFAINHKLPTVKTIEGSSIYGTPQMSASIMDKLTKTNICRQRIAYRLKDWCISRQRSWGSPIPTLLSSNMETHAASKELPVLLDEDLLSNRYTDVGWVWYKVTYKRKESYRETDTFDTFIESSWYYIRYICPTYIESMVSKRISNYWLPVDQYIGGIEHAVMHLLYFRFYHKLLRDAGLVWFNYKEPARRLFCQGMVLAESFCYVGSNISWVSPLKIVSRYDNKSKLYRLSDLDGNEVIHAGIHKMSKSKHNGISPGKVLEIYGADTLRLFIMFTAPANIDLIWSQSGIEGSYRFLTKIWSFVYEHVELRYVLPFDIRSLPKEQLHMYVEVNRTIANLYKDIEECLSFNTAIASIMKMFSSIVKIPKLKEVDYSLSKELLVLVIKVVSPFVPHISSVLWKELTNIKAIEELYWVNLDKPIIGSIYASIAVHINNKLRASIEVPIHIGEAFLKERLYNYERLLRYINPDKPYKVFYVPNKLLNIHSS